MKNKIIALILMLVIFLSVAFVPTYAAAEAANGAVTEIGELKISHSVVASDLLSDNIKEWFNYIPGISEGRKTAYYYRDAYFLEPSTVYNEHLATMSHIVAMISSPNISDELYNESYMKTEKLFTDIGFSSFESNFETDSATTPYTMGVSMAKKMIIENAEPYTLVAIGFRSAGYGSEWASNFTVGTKEECPEGHLGFHQARDHVLEFIVDYLDRNVEGNAKIWLSGFSRGGAISGLTGAWLNDNTEKLKEYNISLDTDDIFTYTFEAPTSMDAELAKEKDYKNIFNIINPTDFIPLLPFGAWGLVRPGIDEILPSFDRKNADKINEILSGITPNVIYDSHEFKPYSADLVGSTQVDFVNSIASIVSSRIDRDTYVKTMQLPLSRMFDKMLNSSTEELGEMFGAFGASLLEDLGLDTENMSGLIGLLFKFLYGDDEVIDILCDAMGKNLLEFGYIETFDAETRGSLFLLLKTLLHNNDRKSLIPHMITVVTNLRTYTTEGGHIISTDPLMTAHNPEIVLAALIYGDSYYSEKKNNIEWTPGYSVKEEIITIAYNDGKRTYSVDYPKDTIVTINAVASGCYGFEGWYINGEKVSNIERYAFIADQNYSVRASAIVDHKAMTEWAVVDEAFGFEAGTMSCGCTVCGSVFTEIIPAPLGDFNDALPYIIGSGVSAFVLIFGFVTFTVIVKRRKRKKAIVREENEK